MAQRASQAFERWCRLGILLEEVDSERMEQLMEAGEEMVDAHAEYAQAKRDERHVADLERSADA